MTFSLFPKATRFTDLLEEQSRKMAAAAALLEELFDDFAKAPANCQRICEIEVEGDAIYRETRRRLSMTFLTPIDREDIQEVNLLQENILDAARVISTRMRLYGFAQVQEAARGAVKALDSMAGLAAKMLSLVFQHNDVQGLSAEVRELKRGAETLLESGLGALYETREGQAGGLFDVIRWTQVHDRVGQALSLVGALAEALEQIGLKYA